MKKLFISQPMRGKTDDEIIKERNKAIEVAKSELEDEEVVILDTFFQNAPASAKPLWFLGKSLEFLADADLAYFAPGWKDARGCRVEFEAAIEYGIQVIDGEENKQVTTEL